MDWRKLAACKEGVDPELFFPPAVGGRHSALYEAQTARAKAVCAGCPVTGECFLFAMDNNEQGVWGGTDDEERKAMRKALKEESAA